MRKKPTQRKIISFIAGLTGGYRQSYGTRQVGGQLTRLSDTQDFTQDECELDAAPGKWTLVFVFPAAVLQDKLGEQNNVLLYCKHYKLVTA